MQNLKYHIINIITLILFSYTSATAINQIIKHNISPISASKSKKIKRHHRQVERRKSFDDYKVAIIDKGLFKIPSIDTSTGESSSAPSANLTELTLLGTITGPWRIARAMIKKRGEKEAGIFALSKINDDITSDVYGYKLSKIRDTVVFLESGSEKYELNLYEKKTLGGDKSTSSKFSGNTVNKTLSRSELQQIASGKLDNATRGLRAGPYRLNGKIVGYRLIRVRPYNILYKMGARSGDIVKRVNGKALDSTEKLMQMWTSLKTESKITVDLERGGKVMTFDYSITD